MNAPSANDIPLAHFELGPPVYLPLARILSTSTIDVAIFLIASIPESIGFFAPSILDNAPSPELKVPNPIIAVVNTPITEPTPSDHFNPGPFV